MELFYFGHTVKQCFLDNFDLFRPGTAYKEAIVNFFSELTSLQILPVSPVCFVKSFLPSILDAISLASSGLR